MMNSPYTSKVNTAKIKVQHDNVEPRSDNIVKKALTKGSIYFLVEDSNVWGHCYIENNERIE